MDLIFHVWKFISIKRKSPPSLSCSCLPPGFLQRPYQRLPVAHTFRKLYVRQILNTKLLETQNLMSSSSLASPCRPTAHQLVVLNSMNFLENVFIMETRKPRRNEDRQVSTKRAEGMDTKVCRRGGDRVALVSNVAGASGCI